MPASKPTKSSGPSAFETRLSALHSYLLGTLTAHTLKDLEKTLPSAVPGLSSMNTKDHIQALVDEGLLRVEKIGTGNWYWAFGSDARIQRTQTLAKITAERDAVAVRLEKLKADLAQRQDESAPSDEDEQIQRGECEEAIAATKAQMVELRSELAPLEGGDPIVLATQREDVQKWKREAEGWTENCYLLEGWMRTAFGLGGEDMRQVLSSCYGEEFGEEEGGLVELA